MELLVARHVARGIGFRLFYPLMRWVSDLPHGPDAGIFGHSYVISMGQWLSVPMIVIGVVMLWRALRGAPPASAT